MKIAITGTKGYVATKFMEQVKSNKPDWQLVRIPFRNREWEKVSLREVDVVLHAAAIVHQKKNTYTDLDYMDINMNQTIALAEKAKSEGVKQFIFLSTLAVFGNVTKIEQKTTPSPTTPYGRSKDLAEVALRKMETNEFKVAIVRPPMIYGPDCPGNYSRLSQLTKTTSFFPNVENKRSMLFIDHLSEALISLIELNYSGTFHPQEKTYISTKQLVSEIARVNHRKITFSTMVGKVLLLVGNKLSIVNKVFGSLIVDQKLSELPISYRENTFQQTIEKTEKVN